MTGRVLTEALAAGGAVFGVFAHAFAPDQGAGRADARDGSDDAPDFVFYDLETGPWDMEAFAAFAFALDGPAVLLRIPPVGPDPEGARRRIAEGLAAGADGLILPQVESAAEVGTAAAAVLEGGRRLWPAEAEGDTLLVVQIESRSAVESAATILASPGVGVGLPGQMDLRTSFGGDERAVQAAVDGVRGECDRLGLPCGVTAGPDDVEGRLEQGFRFVIATAPEAVAVGRTRQGAWRT